MGQVIHILGASGSGTTTLGREISKKYNYIHLDSDNYFWELTDPPFRVKRNPNVCLNMMISDIQKYEYVVLSGSVCGWGDQLIPLFDLVIEVITPWELRKARIQSREIQRFGKRVLAGGDMEQQHQDFLAWAKGFDTGGLEHRSRMMHDEWLKKVKCPKIQVDGTKVLEDIISEIDSFIELEECRY